MVQPCNKCKCPINWDKMIDKTFNKKDGSQGHGWWREDLSKEEHTKERCNEFNNSREFFEPKSIENAKKSVESVKTMDATDFAAEPMKQEVIVHCKYIKIIEEAVIDFLGKDTNPAKIGMYMKFIMEMLEKK